MAKHPHAYSEEMATTICDRISDGLSLSEICRTDGMPSKQAVLKWLQNKPDFVARYARAREAQADHYAEEILEIADNATNDWMKRHQGEETVEVANHDHIARSRLRVDSRKWLMSKLAPKKYGDKIETSFTGEPLKVIVQRLSEEPKKS